MAATLDALMPTHGMSGDARVDHAELATQLEALHPHCFGWAMACCGHRREEAEDMLHDVYLGVLDNGLRFDGRSTLKSWLFGVIARKTRARARRDRLRALLGVTHAARIDRPNPAALPDDGAVTSDRRDRTRRAVGQLPAPARGRAARVLSRPHHRRGGKGHDRLRRIGARPLPARQEAPRRSARKSASMITRDRDDEVLRAALADLGAADEADRAAVPVGHVAILRHRPGLSTAVTRDNPSLFHGC